MTTPLRNLVIGLGTAVVLTAVAIVPTVAGISTWKLVLGLLGIALFVLAERWGR